MKEICPDLKRKNLLLNVFNYSEKQIQSFSQGNEALFKHLSARLLVCHKLEINCFGLTEELNLNLTETFLQFYK